MRKRRNTNKHKNKRIFELIGLFVMITITVGIIYIPKINSKADTVDDSTSDRVIKILDIEPSEKDGLKLKNDSNLKNVEITSMGMSRFISMVDEINGKYDIVYIGNNNDGLEDNWKLNEPYRKYSNMTSLEWGNLAGRSNDGTEKWRQQILWYGIGGNVPNSSDGWDQAGQFYSALVGGNACNFAGRLDEKEGFNNKFVEYYSENDITNKRAKEITKLLDTNQLVYMDSNIFKNYPNTKLFKNFDKYRGHDNFKLVNGSSGLLSTMIEDYKKEGVPKKPIIKFDSNEGKPQDGSRTLKFNFYLEGSSSAKYKACLYLDKDGDGIFTGKSINLADVKANSENSIAYNLGTKAIGSINWKLVIYDTITNIKAYETGNITISSKNNASISPKSINIRVLQICHGTDRNEIDTNLDMKKNSTFQNLINNSEELSDYSIDITTETIADFNKNCDISNLEYNYDMIILGFKDGYGKEARNQFSDNAISALLAWNNAKKSLMLSHDTIGLNVLYDTKTSSTKDNNYFSIHDKDYGTYNLSRNFKDILGQCRYKQDPFINFPERNKNLTIGDNYDNLVDYNPKTKGMRTLGITAYANMKLYDQTRTATGDKWETPSQVELINDSQISNYPFDLGKRNLTVASTHCQWYQLNLEDEDIAPAYDLCNGRVDSGDARNFYYTYTKGNITYTGSGDHLITDEKDEMKLFINTMIKAYTAGNSAPDVDNYIQGLDSQRKDIINDKSTIDIDLANYEVGTPFKFMSNIVDDSAQGEKINVKVTKGDSVLFNNDMEYNGTVEGIYIKDLQISYDELKANIGNVIPITVTATDEQGAVSKPKSFYLSITCSKLKVINGINKDEEEIIKNYSDYERQWYSAPENSGESGTLSNDEKYEGTNIAKVGTRGYQCIIPFISRIDTNLVNSTSISLSLDKNHSQDINNSLGAAEAYYEDRVGSICTKPCLYIDSNGKLVKLKELERNNSDGTYNTTVSVEEVQNAYKSIGVNLSKGDDYSLVVKYYGKTYNHVTNDDNTILVYSNVITVSQKKSVSSEARVNVGYKKLHGNLF